MTIRLDLPANVVSELQGLAAQAGCGSIEEYASKVIQDHLWIASLGGPEHLTFRSDDELEKMLLERLDNPAPDVEATPELWDQLRARIRPTGGGEKP